MLAGQADIAIAYQPSVAAAEAQGAKVVFDFSTYIGPFCNTGIMVLPTRSRRSPDMVQALVTSFEEASRKTYADPAFAKEVARKEFPDLPGEVVDKAIDAELKYLIPAQSVVTKQDQWKNLMDMQVYLGNAKGSVPFDQIIDNSFADKAVAQSDMMSEADRVASLTVVGAGARRSEVFRLSWSRVSKSYDVDGRDVRSSAISACSLDKGEIVSIVGPSGCGKTTLLNSPVRIDRAGCRSYQMVRARLAGHAAERRLYAAKGPAAAVAHRARECHARPGNHGCCRR